jgi:hypothetical protein
MVAVGFQKKLKALLRLKKAGYMVKGDLCLCRHYPDMTGWSHFNPEALSRLCLPQGLRFTNDRARYPPAWHPFLLTKVSKRII